LRPAAALLPAGIRYTSQTLSLSPRYGRLPSGPRSPWNIGAWTMARPDQPHVLGLSQAGRAAAVSDAVCVPASLWCDRGRCRSPPLLRVMGHHLMAR
jgi:hypothetical protein